jgi:hypothetical protein
MDPIRTVTAESGGLSGDFGAVVESVKRHDCILFLGAGIHYPPPADSRFSYPEENRPPLGRDLALKLAEECKNSSTFCPDCPYQEPSEDQTTGDGPPKLQRISPNLQRVSLCYEMRKGRVDLVSQIFNAVAENTKPSAAVRGLAELPFPLVITTNYDRLFEKALGLAGKDPFVGQFDPKGDESTPDYPLGRGDPSPENPFVFKMHGNVDVADSIVITDEDYIGFILRMGTSKEGNHPVPRTFLYRFTQRPTLFVGYSLLDYNLRLLLRTLRNNLDRSYKPNSYAVDLFPDPLIQDVWSREQQFRFIAEDVWDFVPRLYEAVFATEMPV